MARTETVPSLPSASPAPLPNASARDLRIATALGDSGWSVEDGFLPAPVIAALAEEARAAWRSGDFRPAGVGRGAERRINPETRTDRIKWLNPGEASESQQAYLQALEALRLTINRTLYLGLFDFEGHLAVYPPGSFYRKHVDRFRGAARRVVTVILYLNARWRQEDGGQLRIYTDGEDAKRYEDVQPLEGRLVTFLSERFPHEVLPAGRERLSLTGWLRQRDGGDRIV